MPIQTYENVPIEIVILAVEFLVVDGQAIASVVWLVMGLVTRALMLARRSCSSTDRSTGWRSGRSCGRATSSTSTGTASAHGRTKGRVPQTFAQRYKGNHAAF